MLRAGVEKLCEFGFSAVGLDEILKSANIPKGSFYHYFSSKEAFGLALVDEYNSFFVSRLEKYLKDRNLPPMQRFDNFIRSARDGMAKYDFRRGCLVGNLGQEMASLPGSFRQRLIDVFELWQKRIAECLDEARLRDEIPQRVDCRQMSEFFWIGWEGAILRAKLERNAVPLDKFVDGFMKTVGRKNWDGSEYRPVT
ncbi:TetR/AcrR family transcriptional regulator [Bradyrhizobium sp. AUGA SZCCT0176]|nr:TetR/AcrR family transcriptional regulator [Bradyrhizobium sp. AUGA SZCCT0177]MBR1225127.1 TetR/AcrR family transcriptional regulator [Bradyrhizobium sp. AUGA SZCCT0176]MBR1281540.1 TetR/AcrR family transcriptional regulator [Bradyrhizobium sp. AUGA SZCCT0177]